MENLTLINSRQGSQLRNDCGGLIVATKHPSPGFLDMEIWKDIENYEGLYQVSNYGRIKSLARKGRRTEKILNPSPNQKGYFQIALRKNNLTKSPKVQTLVAKAFIHNPENKPETNHKNGIKSDNSTNNLEWNTHSENLKHAFRIGLIDNIGVNNPSAKLNEFQVRVIKNCMDLDGVELGKIFNIDKTQIYSIRSGKTWNHIK